MRHSISTLVMFSFLALVLGAKAADAQWDGWPTEVRPAKPAPKPVRRCTASAQATAAASGTEVTTSTGATVAHGDSIEVSWRLPTVASKTPVYLIGAMPDTVRFGGHYKFDDDGNLASGPGFVALPGKTRAPYAITFAEDRTRIVIPIHEATTPRTGGLRVKPYVAGPFEIEWTVAAVDPSCKTAAEKTATKPAVRLGPFTVASGVPQIVVQDFVAPDPALELAAPDGNQKLTEVEVSQDGRFRLEIFPRRYRVFDRATGAKLVDRSGVKPRFSPQARFVVASIGDAETNYPTNLEVYDLVAGKVVARLTGPIVAWSNGDALALDAGRSYQSVTLFNTLIDPVVDTSGRATSWPYFFPGCSTCDAWVTSNINIDWDRLAVLRADGGSPRAMGVVQLAAGKKVETTSFGDEEAHPLEATLREMFARPDVKLAIGWTGDAPLLLTHVGRGYDGYIDDTDSLMPSEAGRRSAKEFLAPRRIAIADGRVLRAEDLLPMGSARGDAVTAPRLRTRGLPFDNTAIADDLARMGLILTSAEPVAEIEIPLDRSAEEQDPLIRSWPPQLREEIVAANPSLQAWFAKTDFPDIVVAAWRFEAGGVHYLLLQHGDPAMTAAGAHDFRFDLLALDGAAKGTVRTLKGISGLFSQFVGRDHTVARVSILDRKVLIAAVPGSGKAEVVHLQDDTEPRTLQMQEPTVLCGFYEAAPRGLLVQANCDGQMFVHGPASSAKPLLAGRIVDNEMILYSVEGFYASTYEGSHFVHVAFPGLPGVHSFEQFAKALQRPDVISGILSGKPIAATAPELTPPPQIEASFVAAAPSEISARAKSVTGLAAVELYEDGRLADRRLASGNSAEVSFKVDLRPHVRVLTLVAIDVHGFKSRPLSLTAPASKAKPANTLHVLAYGVDKYDALSELQGARIDAETLVASLKSGAPYYSDVRATIRADRDVTPDAVMSDLTAAVAAAGPDDTLLVFFAGHGARTEDGRYFMAVSAVDPARLPETAIDWGKVSELLATSKARVIAVIDACHSGQTGVAAVANDGAVDSLAAKAQAPIVVLAASKGRQESFEAPSGNGGLFTQTLAQLIGAKRASTDTDHDGVLAISELYRSLRQAVDSTSRGQQTPWLVRKNLVGDAPLF